MKKASADTYTGRTGAQRDTRDRDITQKLESPVYRNTTMMRPGSCRVNKRKQRKKKEKNKMMRRCVHSYAHKLFNCYMCRKVRTNFVNLKRLPSKSILSNDVSQKSKYFHTTDISPNNSDLISNERLSAQQFLLKYIISNIDIVSALVIY